jgi:hypothetical protein
MNRSMNAMLAAAAILLGLTGLATRAAAAQLTYNCPNTPDGDRHDNLVRIDTDTRTVHYLSYSYPDGAAYSEQGLRGRKFVEIADDHIDWGIAYDSGSKGYAHLDLRTGVLHESTVDRNGQVTFDEGRVRNCTRRLAEDTPPAPASLEATRARAPGAFRVETTKIGDLMADPAAKAVLLKVAPELEQYLDQIRDMTLSQVAPMSQGAIDQAKLEAIQAGLDAIKR